MQIQEVLISGKNGSYAQELSKKRTEQREIGQKMIFNVKRVGQAKEKRNVNLTIRLTKTEKELLKQKAKDLEISITELILKVLEE